MLRFSHIFICSVTAYPLFEPLDLVPRARVTLFQQPVREKSLIQMAPLSDKRLKLANRIITVTCSGTEATMLNDGWPSSYVCSDLLHTPRDM